MAKAAVVEEFERKMAWFARTRVCVIVFYRTARAGEEEGGFAPSYVEVTGGPETVYGTGFDEREESFADKEDRRFGGIY